MAKWIIEYFRTSRGTSPPEEFLNCLEARDRAKATHYLQLLEEFGVDLGMPHAKPLKGHKPLYELRPIPNRIIYFAYHGHRLVVLHAFEKKRGDTPRREIRVAEKRYKEFLERE